MCTYAHIHIYVKDMVKCTILLSEAENVSFIEHMKNSRTVQQSLHQAPAARLAFESGFTQVELILLQSTLPSGHLFALQPVRKPLILREKTNETTIDSKSPPFRFRHEQ